MLRVVPIDLNTCCQNVDTNFLSRRATPSTSTFLVVGPKWHRFVSRSTTTQMEITSRFVRGKSVMKSIDIDTHRSSGTRSASSSPGGFASRNFVKYARSAPGLLP
ncbi:uncharacterized protein PITG_16970 [Phytophthora infestans T30-4]|uniref:Uncharacterized protein n=1 Tax=Phytophthora infestans (strain T30-4) TaxID=403677 RepID=D0NUI0_PHYIT|nr:uncharacterized protein PITG_16970 [Phytophthora infestans T30-4]EEY65326.1 hypothetical protein PITG_16970 [Phytophthora infestans T30-4]|eukprot:XP_002897189.1 hypothetical protein PITG_16970 [Phytophthora infestans T30-4]